jgi:hypothetical protein
MNFFVERSDYIEYNEVKKGFGSFKKDSQKNEHKTNKIIFQKNKRKA